MRFNVTNCSALTAIVTVVFSVVSGYSSVLSIAPMMVRHFGCPENQVGFNGGILMGAFFLGGTVNVLWGLLSDRVGRRFVFAVSLVGVAASYIVTGIVVSFEAAIICRVAGGVFEARGVAFAAVDDISRNEDERVFAMGVLTITWQLAYCVGPLMAGSLADLSLTLPHLADYPFFLGGIISSLLCLISLILILFCFVEDSPEERQRLLSDSKDGKTERLKEGDMDEQKERWMDGKKDWLKEGWRDGQMDELIADMDQTIDSPKTRRTESQIDGLKEGRTDVQDDRQMDSQNNNEANKLLPPSPPTSPLFDKKSSQFFILVWIVVLHSLYYFFAKAQIEAVLLWGGLKIAHGGLGLSSSALGLVGGITSLTSIPFCLFVNPWIVRRLGVRDTTLVFTLLSGATSAIIPTVRLTMDPGSQNKRAISLTTVFAVWSAFSVLVWQNISLLVNKWSPPKLLGAVNGIAASVGMVACALGPLALGAIISANDSDVVGIPSFWEYGMVFIVLMGLHGLLFVGLCFVPRTSSRN